MPFPLGRRTSSIQTQGETRNSGAGLGRTISLPADDDDVPSSARQHQAARARAANLASRQLPLNPEGDELPLPATAGQKLKFKSNKQRLRVSWGRVSRRLAAGSTPSASLTGSYNEDGSENASQAGPNFPGYHLRRKRRSRTSRSFQGDSRRSQDDTEVAAEKSNADDEVDITVVENDLFKGDHLAEAGAHRTADDASETSNHVTNVPRSQRYGSEATDSIYQRHGLGCWGALRWRVWPVVHNFFDLSFREPDREDSFQKEQWWNGKLLCLVSSCYLVLNWILYVALTPKPNLYDKILYYAVAPVLTIPTPFLVAFNVPRRCNIVWQLWILLNVYFWCLSQVVNQYVCGFYTSNNTCGGMDFVGQGYYAVGLPILALFALGAQRFFIFLGTIAYIVLVAVLIIPLRGKFIRNLVNFIVYIWIFMILSYLRESMDRRISSLRDQLKIQYKATQKAQIAERKSNNSKRRFVSYIFHEVRVPLNTALLALQTLESMDVFKGAAAKDCDIEFTALQGSLRMMSQVLNDVLDFSRMESGRLEHVASSFDFHAALKSMLGALRVATTAKKLELQVNLDDRIDQCARSAAAKEYAEGTNLPLPRDMPALVVGDEMRLRQVVTNLASNACKFTPEGGTITITSKLIFPTTLPAEQESRPSLSAVQHRSSSSQAEQAARRRPSHAPGVLHHKQATYPKNVLGGLVEKSEEYGRRPPVEVGGDSPYSKYSEKELIIVRIEVQDTGVGIRPKDMESGRLFSAYVQTEIGKKQGGKGTGLGLALVRSIVQLSGGRLGLRSKRGEGSCFWVELPFAIGKSAVDQRRQQGGDVDTSTSLERPAMAPMITIMPKYLNSEGLAIALRPVPPATLSFSHTDSSYSHMSQRSDFSPQVEENEAPNDPEQKPPEWKERPLESSSTAVEGERRSVIPELTVAAPEEPPPVLHVLVIDDDPLTRLLMTRTIPRLAKDRKVVTYQAENGRVALEMLLGSEAAGEDGSPIMHPTFYDCVFCDNSMPVMTGPQMVAELRRHNRTDLVVGVTGNALKEDQEEFESAGVDFVLTKPVPARSLQKMIDLAIRRREEMAAKVPVGPPHAAD